MQELIKINYETEQPTVSARDLHEVLIDPKTVYVLLAKDGTVKVGVTSNFQKRLCAIQTASGKEIIQYYSTPICSNVYRIENLTKNKFKKSQILGEWFDCEYKAMVNSVKELFEKYHEIKYISSAEYEKRCEKMINLVKEIWSKPEIDLFFDASKVVLFYVFVYKEMLKKSGRDWYEDIDRCFCEIRNSLMEMPNFFSDEQYDYLFNIRDICNELLDEIGQPR